jgi:hypothetical protein
VSILLLFVAGAALLSRAPVERSESRATVASR